MCGLAAIFAYSPDAPGVDPDELLAIRDRMTTRGPDGAGEWISPDGRVGLAHRRLSIIDLSDAGAQPMWNSERTLCITFNGEIYNYQALRTSLSALGYSFHSGSDTEVLLHLYAQKGADMVHDLRGMFAFAIWDAPRRSLFCARDPFGIKPLYYADDGRTIRVASQVKALLQSRHIDTAPEPAGHVGFFLWGSIPEPFTLYRGIRALPAGHTLTISQLSTLNHQPKSFCSIPELLGSTRASRVPSGASPDDSDLNPQPSTLNAQALLRDSLRDSVRHHLIADVPVGIFLSAGLDSSTLTALVSEIHPHVRTVTLGFEEYRGTENDEVPLAEAVARQYGTQHQTVWITRADFERETAHLFEAMDQPSIDGVNTYFVSLAARRAGLKVVLSGLGGDEIFGGYPSFRDVPRSVSALRPFRFLLGGTGDSPVVAGDSPGTSSLLARGFRVVSAPFLKRFTSPKYAGLLEYGGTYGGAYLLRRGMFMPWELPEFLDPDLVREGWQRLNTLAALNATSDLRPLSSGSGSTGASPVLAGASPGSSLTSALSPLSSGSGSTGASPVLAGASPGSSDRPVVPSSRPPSTDALPSDRLRVSALELTWYMRNQLLRDSDWAGMAHSLEIRVPLVDVTLLRALSPLLHSAAPPTKLDMARSALCPLPSAVLHRPKTGFQTPIRDWLLQTSQHSTLNAQPSTQLRGLRGWAHEVYSRFNLECGDSSPLSASRSRLRSPQVPNSAPNSKLETRAGSAGASPAPFGTPPKVTAPQPSTLKSQLPTRSDLRILVLLSDGFGGFGGIAKFNRDLLTALCSYPRTTEVIALPRLMPHDPGILPQKLTHDISGLGGKLNFVRTAIKAARRLRPSRRPASDLCSLTPGPLIFCGHINLLPAALLAKKICGGSVHLVIHGIDAWQPTRNPLTNACVRRIDGFISVSNVTKQRFLGWSGLRPEQGQILPNCVDLSAFTPGAKSDDLLARYALAGRKVIMTLGRLASEERYKGFDEVLEVLPRLVIEIPGLCYLICGDGPDRVRLVEKAKSLGCEVRDFSAGVSSPPRSGSGTKGVVSKPSQPSTFNSQPSTPLVIFAGRISDAEKADHYRLADVYVMPSSGEGFGIVYLEALACGIPVIGSKVDGSREALMEGKLGKLVDPRNCDEIVSAVLDALTKERAPSPHPTGEGVDYFSFNRFESRLHKIVNTFSGFEGVREQSESNSENRRLFQP